MMRVLNSTVDYKVRGFSYPDFPLLTWTKTDEVLQITTGMLFEEGHEFLSYYLLKRGRVASKKTWNTYAHHMSSFFSFCEDNNQNWRAISDDGEHEMLLSVYRDVSIEDFKLSANSTNQYLRTIIKFYQYAVGQGWVSSLPYSLESVKVSSSRKHTFLAHVVSGTNETFSPDIMMTTAKKPIKFLRTEEIQTLLEAIKNPTLKLMVRLCLTTGIRKKELLSFALDVIRKPRPAEMTCSVLIIGKGSKERSIDIPAALMNDLWIYVNELRFQQQKMSDVLSDLLFLTTEGRGWSDDGDGFNKALNNLNLPFKVHPHKLRHTYATHTLKGLQKIKNTKFEPLMYLQSRLGHSSITTTMQYLHLINELLDDVSLEYQDAINAMEAKEA
jgi:integrase/recombinase XerD